MTNTDEFDTDALRNPPPDDLTGVPGEAAKRAIRRWVNFTPEPQCQHDGIRVGCLNDPRNWCDDCAQTAARPQTWANVPTCMACGRLIGEERHFSEMTLPGVVTVHATVCSVCLTAFDEMYQSIRGGQR